ncbi:MAG: LacI family DNA-binding transcriptional regulator [Spirochaetales bacterium]|nr:LacI family DNA-binding transcriptional regulator [Spirochaetales bacterium]
MGSSLKEIAERVGTSTATVSIYLNHRDTKRVSATMKKKIDIAVKELNYRKNIFASSLSKNESKVIGILIPSNNPLFQNDYTNALLSGIQSHLAQQGYSLLFFPSSADSSKDNLKEQLQNSAGCDGYILFSTGFCSMDHILLNIGELKNTGKPFVTLNIPPVSQEVNQVIIDDLASLKGLEYLLEEGHRKILLVLGRADSVHMKLVLEEYRSILKKWDIPFDNRLIIYGNYSHRDTYLKVSRFLAVHRDISAICAMSDLMASSSLAAIKAAGLTVPGDISLIGRNNSLYSELADPPLTTLELRTEEAGGKAADLLLEIIGEPGTCRKIHMGGEIIERQSVNEHRE